MIQARPVNAPFMQQAFTLSFNNSALQVLGSPFLLNTIKHDDASNAFQITNPNASTITLTTQASNQSRQTFTSTSENLILPIDDGVDPNVGSVNVDFAPRTQDLAVFEAGFIYFGLGEAQVLTALSYPVWFGRSGVNMSVQLLGAQQAPFEILGRKTVDAAWNGSPFLLQVNDNANMPQTPAGTMILAWQNEATQNNLGEIAVTSGGSAPVTKRADALAYQPSIWLNNWNANNLSITNISAYTATPIRIQAIDWSGHSWDHPRGPSHRRRRRHPQGLDDGAREPPQYMQLVIRSSSSTLGILGVIGGPQDSLGNNGYVITVNDAVNGNTGPDTGKAPPPGYYATTSSNTYTFTFNWGGSLVFVANLSPETACRLTVVLRNL